MEYRFQRQQLSAATVVPVVVEAPAIEELPPLSIKEINAALAQIIVKEEK